MFVILRRGCYSADEIVEIKTTSIFHHSFTYRMLADYSKMSLLLFLLNAVAPIQIVESDWRY
jgi:hypothetical protein